MHWRQAEQWVSERMQKMAEDHRADLTNLQAKMKLLQRHQVFEAQILAHGKTIASVLQVRGDPRPAIRNTLFSIYNPFFFSMSLFFSIS